MLICDLYTLTLVAQFAMMNSHLTKGIDPITMKAMIENLQLFNPTAFATDKQLIEEIHDLNSINESSNEKCGLCQGRLLIHSDRPSHITVYTLNCLELQ